MVTLCCCHGYWVLSSWLPGAVVIILSAVSSQPIIVIIYLQHELQALRHWVGGERGGEEGEEGGREEKGILVHVNLRTRKQRREGSPILGKKPACFLIMAGAGRGERSEGEREE